MTRKPVEPRAQAAGDESARTHDTPEAVRDDPNLCIEEKIGILESWAYDDAEISVAVEEGMPGPAAPAGHAQRILQILEALTAGIDLDRTGPSKQHGIPSGSLKSR